MAEGGVRILGGCCGTTPEHIAALKNAVTGIPYKEPHRARYTAATSGKRTALFRGVTLIGERIHPAGRQNLEEALRTLQLEGVLDEAKNQAEAGASLLDVNVSLPGADEPELLSRAVAELQLSADTPLLIDSADPAAIEAAVRVYNGKPVINSVNGKLESLYSILPIAKKYGALVVALTLNEDGVPATAEGRLAIAKKIVALAESEGVPREDILIDCLALTAACQPEQVTETLRAVRMVKAELGVKTVLGVSNVSYGLPDRDSLTAVFLSAALGAGLDAPILNPLSKRNQEAVRCFRMLTGSPV
jgi:5-methyltetrahydrofolate--homocysteine methyltransferase